MKTILVVKYGAMGDVYRTFTLLSNIDSAEVHLLTRNYGDLLGVNSVNVHFDLEKIKSIFFDEIFYLDDDLKDYYALKLVQHDKWIGFYEEEGGVFYTKEVSEWEDMGLMSRFGKHTSDKLKRQNRKTFNQIHAKIFKLDYLRSVSKCFLSDGREIHAQIATREKLVAVFWNASPRWPGKTLDTKFLEKVVQALSSLNLTVLLLGNESPESEVLSDMHIKTNSFDELKVILSKCSFAYCPDSLGLHLAVSLGLPTFSYYGPTSSVETDVGRQCQKMVAIENNYCSYSTSDFYPSLNSDQHLIFLKNFILSIHAN